MEPRNHVEKSVLVCGFRVRRIGAAAAIAVGALAGLSPIVRGAGMGVCFLGLVAAA